MIQIDTPPPPERRPSMLRRAATATRRLIVGRTPEEFKEKALRDCARAMAERAALRRSTAGLRATAAAGYRLSWDDLSTLAMADGVYLTPRRTRFDFDDYALADGLVARVAGRVGGEGDGEYVFLGSDKRLYVGEHDLGRDARPITPHDERHSHHYAEARLTARGYYQLCRSFISLHHTQPSTAVCPHGDGCEKINIPTVYTEKNLEKRKRTNVKKRVRGLS